MTPQDPSELPVTNLEMSKGESVMKEAAQKINSIEASRDASRRGSLEAAKIVGLVKTKTLNSQVSSNQPALNSLVSSNQPINGIDYIEVKSNKLTTKSKEESK